MRCGFKGIAVEVCRLEIERRAGGASRAVLALTLIQAVALVRVYILQISIESIPAWAGYANPAHTRARMNAMPNPHGCRLRRARCSVPGRLYMLTTVTHLRRPLFHDLRFARLVIQNLRYAEEQHHCRSLTWVVMPDHVHWLIELKDVTLGTLMQRFKCQSSNALHKAGAKGKPVWQAGYYDRTLRKDEDVFKVARYIVANPVRAGLVATVGDYPHWDAVWL
jgi:REP element-mobilizing transposase RayT